MSYKLAFRKDAKKEWDALAPSVKEQFKKKLVERLENPRIPSSKLSGVKDRYKIKLRQAGFRLVYEVKDEIVTVVVVAVGKRERNAVYKMAMKRIWVEIEFTDLKLIQKNWNFTGVIKNLYYSNNTLHAQGCVNQKELGGQDD